MEYFYSSLRSKSRNLTYSDSSCSKNSQVRKALNFSEFLDDNYSMLLIAPSSINYQHGLIMNYFALWNIFLTPMQGISRYSTNSIFVVKFFSNFLIVSSTLVSYIIRVIIFKTQG